MAIRQTTTCDYCRHEFTYLKRGRRIIRFCSRACSNRSHPGLIAIPYLTRMANHLATFSDPAVCWLWPQHLNSGGYGVLWPKYRAHRAAWEVTHGPIPMGQCVCHRCDVRHCINPAHLFLGTPAENSADMVQKQRHARGAHHGRATLTDQQVQAIRQSSDPQRELAKRFHVSQANIWRVRHRMGWQHLR